MAFKLVRFTFYIIPPVILLFIGLIAGVNKVCAEDQSSLNINNHVIYDGKQESDQFERHDENMDLFYEESNQQNDKLNQKEDEEFKKSNDKMFHFNENNNIKSLDVSDVSSEKNLFGADYSVSESVINEKQENSFGSSSILLYILLGFGALGLLLFGWLIGKRYSRLLLR